LEHFQEDGRIRGSGLAVTFVRMRYLIERAMLPAPLERATASLDMAVELLKVLTYPGCLRTALVGWLGGSVDTCSGCDGCVRDGALASEQAAVCGSFPYFMQLRSARLAAVEILRSLAHGEQLLTSLLDSPPEGAPTPYNQQSAHQSVVARLVGCRSIHLQLKESRSGGTLLLASASPGALARYNKKELLVWLWKPAAEPTAAATGAEVAEAAQLIAAHQQKIRQHRASMRRVATDMLSRGVTLAELGIDAAAAMDLCAPCSSSSTLSAEVPAHTHSTRAAPAESAPPPPPPERLPPSPSFHILRPKSKRTPSKIAESPELPTHSDEPGSAVPTGVPAFPSLEAEAVTPGRRMVSAAKRFFRGP